MNLGKGTRGDHLELLDIGIMPEYQGKGIGSALLRRGFEVAKEDNIPIFVVAPENAKGFFERHNFMNFEDFDLTDGERVYGRQAFMFFRPGRFM